MPEKKPDMTPDIALVPEKTLLGLHRTMSLAEDHTQALWRAFMPLRHTIAHRCHEDLFSLQVYPKGYFADFNPQRTFEKWAAVEVSSTENIPQGMAVFQLPAGLYAVFPHRGTEDTNAKFQYIFTEWLPASGFDLDERPHFERLGEGYQPGAPDSEESIWIPIRKRGE